MKPELRMIPAWFYVLVFILFTAMSVAICVLPVGAQTGCLPVAYIRVIDGLGANVRAAPVDGQVIAGLKYADGEKVACEYKNGWYRLDNPAGWVSATYNGGRNPLLTVRTVGTAAPSATVRPVITPSPQPTFTNVPDLPRYLLIDQYGSPWECSPDLPMGEVLLVYHREVLPCALAPIVALPTPTRIKP